MLNKILSIPVLLGSQSPRRRNLIAQLGFEQIRTTVAKGDETYPEDLPSYQIPGFLAQKKAQELTGEKQNNEVLITADTMVFLNKTILGKPGNKHQAKEMLRQLSGNTHTVITGVCLVYKEKEIVFSEKTDVKFARLPDEEIDYYVEKFNPLDKAGSYGIQEWIGYTGIEKINGCYYNVMGLPLHRLYAELKKASA